MANTFFGFNTALNEQSGGGLGVGSSPEPELLAAEEEYDALNDETFGALADPDLDWEAQHEQLAEITESSRHATHIESFLDGLHLQDSLPPSPKPSNVWSYPSPPNGTRLPPLDPLPIPLPLPAAPQPRLRTVEELERALRPPRAPPGLPHLAWPPGLLPGLPPPLQLVFPPPAPPRLQHPPLVQQQPVQRRYPPPLHPQQDEYAGLMTAREKQWLLNIQLLQVHTGTPYFDDYYYTMFKERRCRALATQQLDRRQQQQRFDRPNGKPTYTPLQFENSLGCVQLGSVTAPRKIIDTEVLASSGSGRDNASNGSSKALLLELEHMWSLLLAAEDSRNPLAGASWAALLELKQRARLRELDTCASAEAKAETLRRLRHDAALADAASSGAASLQRLAQRLQQRLPACLAVRKGKALLARALPALAAEPRVRAALVALLPGVLAALGAGVSGRRDVALLPGIVRVTNLAARCLDPPHLAQLLAASVDSLPNLVTNQLSMSALAELVGRAALVEPAGRAWLAALADALVAAGPHAAAPLPPLPPQLPLPPGLAPHQQRTIREHFTTNNNISL